MSHQTDCDILLVFYLNLALGQQMSAFTWGLMANINILCYFKYFSTVFQLHYQSDNQKRTAFEEYPEKLLWS